LTFEAILDQAAADIFAVAGVESTFIKDGELPAACLVVVSDEAAIQPGGFDMAALAQVRNIEARLSELPAEPEAGDIFEIASGTYAGTWTVTDELENDGRFVKVAVK
jgi:hypothetical protein